MGERYLVPVKRVMLLDSASLYFRAFYGVPESVTAPDGMPVNAVRGFCDMVSNLVNRFSPTDLVACLDYDWRPAWRVELLPSYKAHRVAVPQPAGKPDVENVPDPLGPQVPALLQVLEAAGLCAVGADGLPGVPGVGAKTAALVVSKYGRIEEILEAARSGVLGGAVRSKILQAADYLAVAPAVVRGRTDVEVPPLTTAIPATPADPEMLAALAEAFGLESAMGRLTKAIAGVHA